MNNIFLIVLIQISWIDDCIADDIESEIGEAVVDDVIENITVTLNIGRDYYLLKRIALVESNYGEDADVILNNPAGGIWQISNEIHATLNSSALTEAASLLNEIENKYQFLCFLCNFNYTSPLKSGLAARLFIEVESRYISSTLYGQSLWWARNYHPGVRRSSFVEKITTINVEQADKKLDLWFLVDGSQNIQQTDFEKSLGFTCSLAARFNVTQPKTHCGFSIYSKENEVVCPFNKTNNLLNFQSNVLNASREGSNRKNLGKALNEVLDDCYSDVAQKDGGTFNKSIVVVTFGGITENLTAPLNKLHDMNITLITVGVGENFDEEQAMLLNSSNTMHFENFNNLTQEENQDKFLMQGIRRAFCAAQLNYTESEMLIICIYSCIDFVGDVTTESDKDFVHSETDKRFAVNCEWCSGIKFEKQNGESLDDAVKRHVPVWNAREEEMASGVIRFVMDVERDIYSNSVTPRPTNADRCSEQLKGYIWFMLDGSLNVMDEQFEASLDFVSSMASKLNVSDSTLRIGLSAVSNDDHAIYNSCNDSSDLATFQSVIASAEKPRAPQNLGNALVDTLKNAFGEDTDERQRLVTMFTDGKSSDNLTAVLPQLQEENIIMVAILFADDDNIEDVADAIPPAIHSFNLSESSLSKIVDLTEENETEMQNSTNSVSTTTTTTIKTTTSTTTPLLMTSTELSSVLTTTLANTPPSNTILIATVAPTYVTLQRAVAEGQTVQSQPSMQQVSHTSTVIVEAINNTVDVSDLGLESSTAVTEESSTASLPSGKWPTSQIMVRNNSNVVYPVFAAGGKTSFQTAESSSQWLVWLIAILAFTVLSVMILLLVLAKQKRSRVSPEDEEEVARQEEVEKVMRDLNILKERAEDPNATKTCVKNLLKKLEVAEGLGIPQDEIESFYECTYRLQNSLDELLSELAVVSNEAMESNANTECLNKLQSLLYKAEGVLIPAHQLEFSYDALNTLKNKSNLPGSSTGGEKELTELKLLVKASNQSTATVDTLSKFEDCLKRAEKANISPDRLRNSRLAADDLKERLNIIGDDLLDFTIQAAKPNATLTDMQKLQRQLDVAEGALIAEDRLKEPYQVLEKLKHRIYLLDDLVNLTEQAKQVDATPSLVFRVKKKIKNVQRQGVPQQMLLEPEKAVVLLKKRVTTKATLKDLSELAHNPVASSTCLAKLQSELKVAEQIGLSNNEVLTAHDAVDDLQKRVMVIEKLKGAMDEANLPTLTRPCYEKLLMISNMAENAHIPPKYIFDAHQTLDLLKKRLVILDDLKVATDEAWIPTAKKPCLDKLEHQIDLGEKNHFPNEEMKEPHEVADDLKYRLKAMEDLKKLTEEARHHTAEASCIAHLQAQLESLESHRIPKEELKESYVVLEELKRRLNALAALKAATDEANKPTITVSCKDKLEKQIEIVESMNVPSSLINDAITAHQLLKKRLKILEELKATVDKCEGPDTEQYVKELERQLEDAEVMKIPHDYLKEAYDVLAMLRDRSKARKELQVISDEARQPTSHLSCMASLEVRLKDVIDHLPPQERRESYAVLKDLKQRVKILDDLRALKDEAMSPTATQSNLHALHKQLELARHSNISEDQLEDGDNAADILKKRIRVMEDLGVVTKEAKVSTDAHMYGEKLKKLLEVAEALELPAERLKESYDVLKLQEERLNVLNELKQTTEEAKRTSSGRSCAEKLRRQLETAEELAIPPEELFISIEALQELKNRFGIVDELKAMTEEAKDPTAGSYCLIKLKRQIELVEKLGTSGDDIKEAQAAMSQLESRVEIMEELKEITNLANKPTIDRGCMEKLKKQLEVAEDHCIHPHLLKQSYEAADLLKKRIHITEDLHALNAEAQLPGATLDTMLRFDQLIDRAAILHLPPVYLEEPHHTLGVLKERIADVRKKLITATNEADDMDATAMCLENLRNQLEMASKLQLVPTELDNAKKAVKILEEKDAEIKSIKADLKEALSGEDSQKVLEIMTRVDTIGNVHMWNPEDHGFASMLAQAEDIKKELLDSELSPEEIAIRNTLRGNLENVLDRDDLEPDDLEEMIKAFEERLTKGITQRDTDILEKAKRKLIDITRYKCILGLQRGIGMRDGKMLDKAFEFISHALETKLKGYDLKSDHEFVHYIDTGNGLLTLFDQLERMKSVVMSLKQPTISEVRSYGHPPAAIYNVMEATYILLGIEKSKLKSWHNIQVLIGKTGKEALKRKIWERDLESVRHDDALFAEKLISGLKVEDVEAISKAGSVFYSWSKCVIQEVRSRQQHELQPHHYNFDFEH